MNLDELRSVQSAERQSDALQHLRDGFYRDAGEYVQELRDQRRVAAEDAADPYGDEEVRRLTDEIETAKNVTEAIWEARIGKILREASLSATDMSASAEGLTPEEQALFERVVDAIEANRETIQSALESAESESVPPGPALDQDEDRGTATKESDGSRPTPPEDRRTVASRSPEEASSGSAPTGDARTSGTSETTSTTAEEDRVGDATTADAGSVAGDADSTAANAPADQSPSTPTPDGPSVPAADDTSEGSGEIADSDGTTSSPADANEDSTDGAATEETERVRVRITEDVGTIAGVDGREYHLAADDVAELPEANARPLIERDAANALE
jgi:DNA replication factor GINS